MKTRRSRMKFVVCLLTVAVLVSLAGACGGPAEAPTTPTPAPTTPAPTTPAPTTPAPTTPAPTAPAPSAPAPTKPAPSAPAPSGGPQYGGVLRYIMTEGPEGSIGVPENMRGPGASIVKLTLFDPLLMLTSDGQVLPCLAESYEWSDDHLTLTLHLRKDVTFHDGTPFNAEAVKWNWDKRAAAHAAGTTEVASTEVVDEYTFRFHLKEFSNCWIGHLCSTGPGQSTLMISPTAYEENGEEWNNWNPVGTGPFKFKSFERDQYLEVERNDDYWGDKPYLDGIKWLIIADAVTAQISFEAGEADYISIAGKSHEVAKTLLPKGYQAITGNSLLFALIPSGAKSASPWSNQKVREAAEYAIDKKKIVEAVYGEWGIALYQFATPDFVPYDPNFKGREYDPDKARQLLAEAGYPNGFKTSLYCQNMIYGKSIDAVQAYLAQVGIDAKLEVITVGKWIEMETNGWEDGLVVCPQGSGTFSATLDRHWVAPTEPNWSRGLWWNTLYRPPEMETLIQQYYKLLDVDKMRAKGREILQVMFDNAIAIPLWSQIGVGVMQPYVHPAEVDYGRSLSGGLFDRPAEKTWMEQ